MSDITNNAIDLVQAADGAEQIALLPDVKDEPESEAKTKTKKSPKPQVRFGIGEWYGHSFVQLTMEQRRYFATIQGIPKEQRPAQPCPFKSTASSIVNCSKAYGVCSLRSYRKDSETGTVGANVPSTLRTTCPNRFEQDGTIYKVIGEKLLGDANATPIGETPFLKRVPLMGPAEPVSKREVGRIDNILVRPGTVPLEWAPVEKQSVYFSGQKMSLEFQSIIDSQDEQIPFPLISRRPDYRSSGPKRLLPQLEIKVPTIRTWGRKLAVVVDEDFFNQLGYMEQAPNAPDISNAEVIWFVVKYTETPAGFKLEPLRVYVTTLPKAIEGLVAAIPVSQGEFETKIQKKLKKLEKATSAAG